MYQNGPIKLYIERGKSLKSLILLSFLVFSLLAPSMSWAQESYDPFTDFSEYEEVTEEEADVNFFRNGRFVTLGLIAGYRGVTADLGEVYEPGLFYGLQLSYFFDLRFALQFSFMSGQNKIDFTSESGRKLSGNSETLFVSVHLKHYFNTENVTKGLANLNPYLIGGYSYVNQSTRLSDSESFGGDNASSFDLGFGIEWPLMRNQSYVGFQALYNLVNFPAEGEELVIDGGTDRTGFEPSGDMFHVGLTFGTNF